MSASLAADSKKHVNGSISVGNMWDIKKDTLHFGGEGLRDKVCEKEWVKFSCPRDFAVLDMGFPAWLMSLVPYSG